MTEAENNSRRHTREDVLTEFAAGTLSPARHIIVACQSDICDQTAADIRFREQICANLIQDEHSVDLSDDFLSGVLEALPRKAEPMPDEDSECDHTPQTLLQLLGNDFETIRWRKIAPGVAIHHIMSKNGKHGEKLYLLRARPGMQFPEHSHTGEEWTLIMRGSYVSKGKQFVRGDLHIEDDDTTHEPFVDSDEECICLVSTEGPLKMKPFMAKLFQPLTGI